MHLLPRRAMQHPAGVAEAATTLAAGGLAILLDDETGVADLVMAARRVTREGIALMAVHGRGLTELALSPARVAALRLPPMVPGWDTPRKPFTVSIEAREGVSTGISARDRAHTIGWQWMTAPVPRT
jgi:3,4-dihydroxy-2-butanone 4-phosphate synthase